MWYKTRQRSSLEPAGALGREIAVALGSAGARVGLVARSKGGLEETKRLIGDPRTQIWCTDLRDESAIAKLAESVNADFAMIGFL